MRTISPLLFMFEHNYEILLYEEGLVRVASGHEAVEDVSRRANIIKQDILNALSLGADYSFEYYDHEGKKRTGYLRELTNGNFNPTPWTRTAIAS